MTNDPNILTNDEVAAFDKCGRCEEKLVEERTFNRGDIVLVVWRCENGHSYVRPERKSIPEVDGV